MGQSIIRWVQNHTFIGTDSGSHSVVLSDAEDGVGMKPSDLMLIALASCTAVSVVEILQKKRTPLASLEISVDGEQDPAPPWTYRSIHLTFTARGKGITEDSLMQAIRISEEKYCSVAATLRGVAKISWAVSMLPGEE